MGLADKAEKMKYLKTRPKILLINPWIEDFAAYDFWAKPIGLLYLGAILREYRCRVSYIDCLDRFHPMASHAKQSKPDGRGPYPKMEIEKPKGLEDVPRTYCRYGIKQKWFEDSMSYIDKPDLILVTSHMTYWYLGVKNTISVIKEKFCNTPVILGGIYATLCYEHAVANSGADLVIKGAGEIHILELVEKYTGWRKEEKRGFFYNDFSSYPYPAFDLQNKTDYIPILTSKGCPYKCAYCASSYLIPQFATRTSESVINEIFLWHNKYNIKNFAFYDDALLVNADKHIIPILEAVVSKGYKLRFYTPNAIHAKNITPKIASLMFKAGFDSIRIGVESADFEKRGEMDKKITKKDFENGIEYLKNAGFRQNRVGAYLLIGLPGQDIENVAESIKFVKKAGIMPILAYYTPIPHTDMWKKAVISSRYDLKKDPVFTNNAIFPCMDDPFSDDKIVYLKRLVQTK